MKRAFFAIASLAVILSSCSKDLIEHDSTKLGSQINFSAYLQRSNLKQLNNTDLSGLQANGFTVNAYNTAAIDWNNGGKDANTLLFNQQQVGFANGVWSYTPAVLWPNNDKVSFFAHSPANVDSHFALNGDNDGVIHFVQKQTRNDQYDLLVSYLLDNTKASVNAEGKLGFSMKHALSRVGFKAKYIASPNITSVEVTNVVIKYSADLQTGATFKFTGANSLDVGANPWSGGVPSGVVSQEAIADPIAVGTTFGYILNNVDGSAPFNPNNSKNFVLLIPQNITAGMITISMEITANRADGTTESWTITDRDLFDALNNRGSASLQSGKAYDFTFNFNVDHSTVDPNDPTTPIDPNNILIRFDVTQIAGWDVTPGDFIVTN